MTEKISPELKKIVLRNLDTIPLGYRLYFGHHGTFAIEQLKHEIEIESEIGVEFAKQELEFIKDCSSGEFSKILSKKKCI